MRGLLVRFEIYLIAKTALKKKYSWSSLVGFVILHKPPGVEPKHCCVYFLSAMPSLFSSTSLTTRPDTIVDKVLPSLNDAA